MKHRIQVYRSRSLLSTERWRWRLVSSNGNIIATSGEGYRHKVDCRNMAERVVRGDYSNVTIES